MKTSVEISYYPLKVEYISPIKNFIERLNTYQNLIVKTSGISTHIFGDYFEVMQALTKEIHKSFELPNSIFVFKIINADLQKI